uniref:Ubiquitin-protein ligase E3 n=1 Tax=Hevea brasiliensis TaxID=3981 RepID=S5G984_HEVBR|nr:ubiquitin-protein ligase E3 [Hevea brasiliensis]
MRVSPWNQYQLVDTNQNLTSSWLLEEPAFRGRASFVCFGRASAGLDSPSPLKVGPTQQQGVLPDRLVTDKVKDHTTEIQGDSNARRVTLKSSLKKPLNSIPVPVKDSSQHYTLSEKGSDIPGLTERRKVQWTDVCGSELVEIREFEPSETADSDDEFENGNERSCSCVIM